MISLTTQLFFLLCICWLACDAQIATGEVQSDWDWDALQSSTRRNLEDRTTDGPSSAPSTVPSQSPSMTPVTSIPSLSPSSSAPSAVPSQSPSMKSETSKPSSSSPSAVPSQSPSVTPVTAKPSSSSPSTSEPSAVPSQSHSMTPVTAKPSSSSPSTSEPSAVPSQSPFVTPVTSKPSSSPSTSEPSAVPSPSSSAPVTSKPSSSSPSTSEPSAVPSQSPFVTSKPSKNPSKSPTSSPVKLRSMPSILVLLADDLDFGDVEYNGGKALMPNLQQLAFSDHTLLLDRLYSASSVCSPTRAALLSGRVPERDCVEGAQITDTPLPVYRQGMPSMGVDARKAGMTTAFFGKWHLGRTPGDLGFEYWVASTASVPTFDPSCPGFCEERKCMDNCRYHRKFCFKNKAKKCSHRKTKALCTIGHLKNSKDMGFTTWGCGLKVGRLGQAETPYFFPRGVTAAEHMATLFASYAIALTPGIPFYVQLSFHEPHRPFFSSASSRNDCFTGKTCRNIDSVNSITANYYGTVTALDKAIGIVMAVLRSLGRDQNTIVVFTADNGGEEPGVGGLPTSQRQGFRGHKRLVYEGGIRVPGVFHWPAMINQHFRVKESTSLLDLVPTFHDIFSRIIPSYMPEPAIRDYGGESLLPLIENSPSWVRSKPIGVCQPWSYLMSKVCLRFAYIVGRFKLIAVRGQDSAAELYDIVADPMETRNIAFSDSVTLGRMLPQAKIWADGVFAENVMHRCPIYRPGYD